MTDSTTQTTTGDANSGAAAQGSGATNDLAQAIASAVAAAVSTTVNDFKNAISNAMSALESRVKQTSANDDNNFETSVVGAYDPFDDLRRSNVSRDRVAVLAEQALANAVQVASRCSNMHLDHSAALPPIAPRSASGPGTSAS